MITYPYADIRLLDGTGYSFYLEAEPVRIINTPLKNLGECDDEYFRSIKEKLAKSYACYSLSMQEHCLRISQAFDIQFFFLKGDRPIPKPRLEPGDTLYLFEIPVIEGVGPNYLGSFLSRFDIKGEDDNQIVSDRGNML